jgi:hypothetical protein
VDVEVSFPARGQAAELVQQGEGLLDDVAQLAETFDAGGLALRMIGSVPRSRQARRKASLSYPLSASRASKRRRGRPRRPPTGGEPSSRSRAPLMSGTFAPLVSTSSGVPLPSQIRWCF